LTCLAVEPYDVQLAFPKSMLFGKENVDIATVYGQLILHNHGDQVICCSTSPPRAHILGGGSCSLGTYPTQSALSLSASASCSFS
jgi:hypothetical protein